MSRRFSGTNDAVAWSIGGASCTGAWTFAVILKLDTGVTWQGMLGTSITATGSEIGIERHGTGGDFASITGGGAGTMQSGLAISSADGWMLLAASRPSGSNQIVRYTKYPIGGSPSHSNSNATGHDNSAAQDGIYFGHTDGVDDFDGWLACAGIWTTNLNDAQMESLASTMTRANWQSTSPAFLVDELDAFSSDYAGTSTRTTLTGTTDDADDPTGWETWGGPLTGAIIPPFADPSYTVQQVAKGNPIIYNRPH